MSAVCNPIRAAWWCAPLRYLGKISYGIYLWHMIVLATLVQVTAITGWQLLGLTLALTWLLAAVSWHFIEQPFTRHIKLRLGRLAAQ